MTTITAQPMTTTTTTDPTEVSLGITTYLSSTPGFSAVLKARYSDFLVHEVAVDGTVAYLTNLDAPTTTTTTSKKEKKDNGDASVAADADAEEKKKAGDKRKKRNDDDDDDDENPCEAAEQGPAMKKAPPPLSSDPSPSVVAETTTTKEATASTTTESTTTTTATTKKKKPIDEADIAELAQLLLQSCSSSDTPEEAASKLAKSVADFVQQKQPQTSLSTTKEKYLSLPASDDKATRQKLHAWIRAHLHAWGARAETATEEEANNEEGDSRSTTPHQKKVVRIWHAAFEKDMPPHVRCQDSRRGGGGGRGGGGQRNDDNRNNNNNNFPRPPPGKPYLRFVLYKENLDTGSALQQIKQRHGGGGGRGGRGGRRGRGGRGGDALRLGYAGMKDKRGVTAQFLTVAIAKNNYQHQSLAASLARAWNRHPSADHHRGGGGGGGCANRGGGGHTRDAGVAVMRVGNFAYVADELRLGRLAGNRFDIVLRNIIYQDSVGDHDNATTDLHSVLSKAARALGETGFINYFGVQRFGKFHDTHTTGIAVLQGNYEQAVDIILRPKPNEREHIAQARKEWQNRFRSTNDGTLEGNGSASPPNMETKTIISRQEREKAEADCAKKIGREFGRFMASEVAVLESLARHPLDYKRAFCCIGKTMRMMFVHALQSYLWNHAASHRISELGVAVLPGDLVLCNDSDVNDKPSKTGESSILPVKRVTEEDIKERRYSMEDVVLPLIGSRTEEPQNETLEIVTKLLEDNGLNRDMIAKFNGGDFACTGDYRKVLCRPADVDFEILEYTDPKQPLVQTDLMKLQGLEVQLASADDASNIGTGEDGDKRRVLMGMRVGFTLPSSAYATIAIRELMKQPTSAEYQGELDLGELA